MRPVLIYWQFLQLVAMGTPAFYQSLTQPERYVHLLITAITSLVAIQAFKSFGRFNQAGATAYSRCTLSHSQLRSAPAAQLRTLPAPHAVAVLSLIVAECLVVASKSIVPLWSQRLWLLIFCAVVCIVLSGMDYVLATRRINRC